MAGNADRFAQLTGAFDDPIAPSPAFAARLRALALAELSATPLSPAASSNGVKEDSMVAIPTVPPPPTRRLRAGQRPKLPRYLRWTKPMALVNVAAILLLLIGIVRLLAPDKPAPNPTYRLPAIASQTTGSLATPSVTPQASPVTVQVGENPGQTGQYDLAVGHPTTTATLGAPLSPNELILGGALVHDGTLYRIRTSNGGTALGTRTSVENVSLANGTSITSFFDPNQAPSALMLFGNDLLIVSNPIVGQSTGTILTAIDARGGDTRWSMRLFDGETGGYPILADNMLYVPDQHGNVAGADLATHKVVWTAPVPIPGGADVTLAAGNGTLYAASGFYLTALDPATGAIRWQLKLSEKIYAIGGIEVTNGTIVVGGTAVQRDEAAPATPPDDTYESTRILAIDARNHDVRWQYDTPDGGYLGPVANGVVLAGRLDTKQATRETVALDLATGKAVWTSDAGWTLFADRANAYLAHFVDQDGKEVGVSATPTASSRWMLKLTAVDLATGTPGWTLDQTLGSHGPWSIRPVEGGLVISQGNGTVLRFGPGGSASNASPVAASFASPVASPAVATPEALSRAMQLGADPGQTNAYDVSVGIPKNRTVLGKSEVGVNTMAGSIVAGGTLYRVQGSTDPATAPASVVAVSLADGSTHTLFADPDHATVGVMFHGDTLLVAANPEVGRSTSSTLTAIDASTGRQRWTLDLFTGAVSKSQPLLANDTAFVPDEHGTIHTIDLSRHKEIWTAPVSRFGIPSDILAAETLTLYVANGVDVTALDPATGATRWQADLSGQLLTIQAMSVSNGRIAIGGPMAVGRAGIAATPSSTTTHGETAYNASRILVISARDHTVLWHWDTNDQLTPQLIIAGGNVLIGHGQGGPTGDTTALDLGSGKVAWQLQGAMPLFADRDQVIGLQLHAAPGRHPATPHPISNRTVFQTPTTETSITLFGIDPATGTTNWVLGESIGPGGPVAYLPLDGGLAIPLSNGQTVVLRD